MSFTKSVISLAILLAISNLTYSQNEVVSCNYLVDEEFGYTCVMSIRNLNGVNNFTEILGTHVVNHSDEKVMRVFSHANRSITTNVPSIICATFNNSKRLHLRDLGIRILDEHALRGCERLVELEMPNNNITNLPANVFKDFTEMRFINFASNQITQLRPELFTSMINLEVLRLNTNFISELPRGIFIPVRNLQSLELNNNRLRAIHSDSFGVLPKFHLLLVASNFIQAIDERFIDNTDITSIDIRTNTCANVNISDTTAMRNVMRNNLATCLINYVNLVNGKLENSLNS